jgi:hypothetical protein
MKTSTFPGVRSLLAGALLLSQALLPGLSNAQVPAVTIPVSTQFSVTGFIQAATLDPTCAATDLLCGGTITVNDQVYVVPRNTVLQMPASALTWPQVFRLNPGQKGQGATAVPRSGLATLDNPRPANNYEASLVGNRIKTAAGDQAIVGLMFLAQHSLQSGQGYINWIDYSTGEFRVGGDLSGANQSTTGTRVKINDPIGRFSRLWTADPRFTIDENNPTIKSGTGVPMCIPRFAPAVGADDAWCPQKNRPLDVASPSGFNMVYTMPATTAPVGPNSPDPKRMVPFEIGDYVTYSGIIDELDTARIAAWAVDGNVGVHTALGDTIAYVATEVALLGVGGTTVAGVAEATIRTRFEGFTSAQSADPALPTLIGIYGVDVDCANAESMRLWGAIDVDAGPPTGAVPGRWRFRPPLTGGRLGPGAFQSPSFLPATREVKAAYLSPSTLDAAGNVVRGNPLPEVELPTADCPVVGTPACSGLTANSYQAPIFEFLFPENVAIGTPVVPNNFDDMPFLANGSGPINGVGSAVQGTLSPWPGATLPTTGCKVFANAAPNVNAGTNQTVTVSNSIPVILTGNGVDPNGLPLTFVWSEVAAPAGASLLSATTASPVGAPNTGTASFLPTAAGTRTFRLTVSNGVSSSTATVSVLIVSVPAADVIIPTLLEYRTTKQRLTVTVTDAAAAPTLTLTAFTGPNATGSPMCGVSGTSNCPTLTALGGGIFTEIWIGVALPASVKISSSLGGVSVQNLTAANPIFKLRQ